MNDFAFALTAITVKNRGNSWLSGELRMFLPSNITLQFGDSGDFVSELQRRLAAVNAHSADAVTGFYDGITVSSVTGFQTRNGLRGDGVAGPETLRRLNGIISGDTSSSSSSSSNQEEEAKQDPAAALDGMLVAMDEPPLAPVVPVPEAERAAPQRTESVAIEPAAVQQQQSQQEQAAQLQREMQQQQHVPTQLQPEQIQRELKQHAHEMTPQQQSAGEMLAQMLMQQTQQKAVPAAQPEAAPKEAPKEAPAHAAPQAEKPVAAKAATPEPEQPKGLVGRALQKMDAMLQKMTDYFETKLSPDVVREVKQIGQIMMQSGVKEAPIPTGPEQTREQIPARGPEQQQVMQRG